ncbi:hypothetical protein Droror1_Dr00003371 [Drosera rotundifolia]
MRLPFLTLCLLSFPLFTLLIKPAFCIKNQYIVYLGVHDHAHAHDGLEVSEVQMNQVKESHYELLGSYLGSYDNAKDAIYYSYTRHINGFAAMLDVEDAKEIAEHPSVISVFLDKGKKLHTTHSWTFMGLENNGQVPSDSIWEKARYGEDTIIANLDTGAWPEAPSFGDGGLGAVPKKWKGACVNGNISSPNAVVCNRKLIGAKYYNNGYLQALAAYNASALSTIVSSARDFDGHGSHTLSTAGGISVAGASVFGFGTGTASGGSPKARVAPYKVCWPPIQGAECFDSDILAGFDSAIYDGVDVISVSLGGSAAPYFEDSIAIGAFHAILRGIVVVASAGNSGPADATVSNVAPWLITVGASTMDRDFANYVELGNGKRVQGQSLAPKKLPAGNYPLISAADAAAPGVPVGFALLCEDGTLDPSKAKGKILVCLRGVTARVDKGEQCLLAGAVGMVLANDVTTGNELIADAHLLPASHITYSDGIKVYSYINSTKKPTAYITYTVTEEGIKPAPFMAAFSSRGPNNITAEILKPDITAPGVSVIAAFTEAQGPTDESFDTRRVKFNSLSGTSMSCPHISGVVGLLKTLYPHWSPAAIRSAIMTTAFTRGNNLKPILNSSYQKADVFSYGAGHVDPNLAADPGLVYDLTVDDYLNFLCTIGYGQYLPHFTSHSYSCPLNLHITHFNYPSITVPRLNFSITVTRTLKNVGPPGTYKVFIKRPPGIFVHVKPKSLTFDKVGDERSFNVHLKLKSPSAAQDYVSGMLRWSFGKYHVRSPIVVKSIL